MPRLHNDVDARHTQHTYLLYRVLVLNVFQYVHVHVIAWPLHIELLQQSWYSTAYPLYSWCMYVYMYVQCTCTPTCIKAIDFM